MKLKPGDKVIILSTEYKPAGSAVIKSFNADTQLYKVDFSYYNNESVVEIEVPPDRLLANMDMVNNIIQN